MEILHVISWLCEGIPSLTHLSCLTITSDPAINNLIHGATCFPFQQAAVCVRSVLRSSGLCDRNKNDSCLSSQRLGEYLQLCS